MPSRFRPYRHLERFNLLIAIPLAAMLVQPPALAQQAGPVVAPNTGNTRVYTSGNGVPVVDIATANNAGLSHNKFTSYDVPTQGLVLNNAAPTQFSTTSQLAGTITTNFNLNNQASVILNEVVAPNATTIAGYTEVVGGKADVVVANPYGIAVKGGAFINTNQVTLATGTPMIDASGALTGLHVTSGELSISGTGLYAPTVGLVNLLARAVKIDGQVATNDLLVAGGANDFNYATRDVKANGAASGTAPAYAIDSSALGGMYANRIRLIATDAGVGVRMLGDVAATTDDLTLTAAGKVELSNRAYAERDLQINARSVAISGGNSTVTAKRDLSIAASSGGIASTDANVSSGHDVSLTASGKVELSNNVAADNDVHLSGARVVLSGGNNTISAKRDLTVVAGTDGMTFTDANVAAGRDLNLTASSLIGLSNKAYAEHDLQISGVGVTVTGGNTSLTTKHDLRIDGGAGAITFNDASIISGGNMTLGAASFADASSTPQTASNRFAVAALTASFSGNATIAGSDLGAGTTLALTAGAIDLGNLATLYSGADKNATARGLALRATTGNLNLADAQLTAPTTIGLTADHGNVVAAASGSGTGVQAGTDLTIAAGNGVTTAGNLTAGTNLSLNATGTVANDGNLIAGSALAIGGAGATLALNNNATGVIGGKTADVHAATLTNRGAVQGSQGVTVNVSGLLTNAAKAVVLTAGEADRDVTVSVGTLSNAGFLQSTGALTIDVAGVATNTGVVATQAQADGGADRGIAFTTNTLNNSGTVQSAAGLNFTAKSNDAAAVTNTGTVQSAGDASYRVGGGLSQGASGAILGGGNVAIQSGSGDFMVANSGRIQAAHDLTIGTSGARVGLTQAAGGIAMSGAASTLTATTIDVRGALQASDTLTLAASGAVTNEADGIVLTTGAADKAIALTAASLTNAGNIQATGAITATLGGLFDNSGVINGTGQVAISGQQLTNERSGVVSATDSLTVNGAALTNAGLMQSTRSLTGTLSGNITNTVDGVILTSGTSAAPIALRGTAVTNAGTISSVGALKIDAATLTNSGSQIAAGQFDLSVNTSLTNSGLLQADGKFSLLTPVQLQNTATGRILGGADVFLSGRPAWTLVNNGRIQAAGTLNVGNGDRVTLTNEGATATLFAGTTLSLNALSIANSGLLRGTSGAGLDVLNGLTNSTTGVVVTAGQPGGSISINAGTLTNAGAVQSAGGINANVAGALSNTGTVVTESSANGGNDGAIAIDVGVLANSGTIQSANYFSLVAEDGSGTSFSNSGTLSAAAAVRIWAPTAQSNTGVISAGDQLVMVSTKGAFNLTNAAGGYIQSGADMSLGDAADRATLANDGYILSRGGLVTRADTITNHGVIQAQYRIDAQATGAVVNTGTASNGAGPVTLGSASLTNSGNVQATDGALTVNTSGGTTNSGNIVTNGQYVGNVTLGADNVTNTTTGNINSGASIGITTIGSGSTTFTNSGNVVATNDVTLTTNHGATNSSTGLVSAGGNVTITSGNGSFTVTNGGIVQAGVDLTIGKTGQAVALTNQGNAVLLALGNLAVTGSTVTNSGNITGIKSVAMTLSGALTNNATGTITAGNLSVPTAFANITVTAASISNAGNIASTGAIRGTASGTITNSGNIIAGNTSLPASSDMSITLTGSTLTNTAVIQSNGVLTLVATAPSGTTVSNSGTLQSSGNMTVTSPGQLTNTGRVLTTGSLAVAAGSTAFALVNDGRIQAAQNIAFGTSGSRVALTNHATGVVQADGALTTYASTVTNSNLVQSAGTMFIDATGALTNAANATILTAGTVPATMTWNTASVTNAGTIQSSGAMTGTVATLVANTGKIVSDGTLTLRSGAATFTISNDNLIQSTGALTLGDSTHRAALTNTTAAVILAGGTASLFDTTLINSGKIQANGPLAIDAAGAFTNNASGLVLTKGTAGSAVTITGVSLTSAGVVQSAGNLTLSLSGNLNNSGTLATMAVADGGADGALQTTTGADSTNSGNIASAGTLNLSAATTLTNATSGVIKSVGNSQLHTGTALTNASGATIDSGDTLSILASGPFSLTNNGTVQSTAAMTIGDASHRTSLTNTSSGVLHAGAALATYASDLSNAGTVQAGGAATIDVTGAAVNNGGGVLLTGGHAGLDLSITAASLTNAASVQSSGNVTLTLGGALINSGTISTVATGSGGANGKISAASGANIDNSGTVSSAGALSLTAATTFTNSASAVIKSAGAAQLKTGTALTNASGASIASDDSLTLLGSSPFTLSNNGVLQSDAALTIGDASNRATLTNASGATVNGGGTLTAYVTSLSNSGTFQSGDEATVSLTAGSTLTNAAGAKLLSTGGLALDTASAGALTINNTGILQSGGLLKLGGTGTVTLNNAASAKIMTDTFSIKAAAVENYGRIAATNGGNMTASSFYNHGSTSKFIASTEEDGAATLTISGSLTNEGAMFGAGNFTVSASNIANTSTGGMSSQNNLSITATASDIINDGALYAGGKLTLTAPGLIKNTVTGTIDTDGDFASTSNTFYNQNQINLGGSGTITATTFKNVMVGAENISRSSYQPSVENQHNYIDQGSSEPSVANISTSSWYYTGHGPYDYPSGLTHLFDDRHSTVYGFYYNKQFFDGISDPSSYFAGRIKPQINATNLTITGFDSGENIGAMISGTGTVAINGSGSGSTFTNDALNLTVSKYNYQGTWWYQYTVGSYDWWNPTGDSGGQHITDVLQTIAYTNDYFTVGSGIQAHNLTWSNIGTLNNLGSANSPHVDAASAESASPDAAAGAVTVNAAPVASAASFVSVTAPNSVAGASAAGFASAATSINLGAVEGAHGRSLVSAAAVTATGATGLGSGKNAGLASSGTSASGGSLFGALRLNPFAAISAAEFAKALKSAKLTFGKLTIKLPTNPNGYFIANTDPAGKYIISVNSDFGIDTSTAVGSDLFTQLLAVSGSGAGGDDEKNSGIADPLAYQEKRLGDPAYETYLVRQQLVDQLGTRLLAGEKSEADQMRMLITNGASEASRLGLQFGQNPTADQLANLDHDMVWMVDQVVAGEHVLVPQVFLSAKTKSMFDPKAASIAADNMDMDIGTLNNNGGTIGASDNLKIKTTGDVKNLSGSITGGNVSIDAGGSIINETTTTGNKDSAVVGATAKIGSKNDLDLKAKNDIKVLGADLKAGGNASIDAGNEIVVDTVQSKTTSHTSSSTNYGFAGSTTETTTVDVKNHGSTLDIGGNLKLKSGGDTTLAGAKVDVKGDLDTDVGGSLNVLARQDQHTVTTKEETSGLGVNGGLYGSDKKDTTDFTGTNFGTTLNVGGNATLKAKKDITLEGADVDIKGDGSIDATNVNILDGKDEHRVTTKESKTTVGVFTDSDSSAGAGAKAKSGGYSASTDTEKGGKTTSGNARLSGDASANAHAEGSGSATIGVRTQDTDSVDYTSTSHSTNLKIGGNASIKAKETLTVRGSNLESGGDMNLEAKDQQFLAGQDVHYTSESDKTMTVGMKYSGEGSAEANAKAKAGPGAVSGGANAEAKGQVGAGFSYEDEKSTSTSLETKAHVSTIKSGGNLTRKATNSITDVGTDIEVEGDLDQSAKTIRSLAAHDTKTESTSSTKNSFELGVYADAHAGASAKGSAGAGTGTNAGAEASAGVSAGGQMKFDRETSDTTSNSDTAVVSNIKVKGKMTSTSTDKTELEGTNIETGGDLTLSAKSLDYRAAVSTESETSNSTKLGIDLKGGVGAGASASTKEGGDAGYGPQGSLGFNYGKEGEKSSSRDEEGGKISSGGKITIKTTDDAHFVGTEIESKDKTKISAGGSVTFDATHSTSTTSTNNLDVGLDIAGGKTGKGKSAELGLDVGYGKSNSSSDKAKAGSISADGGLDISAGKNATFEGTDLSSSDGNIRVSAKQDVTFKQATSTSSSDATNLSLGVSMEGSTESKGGKHSGEGEVEKKGGLNLGVGLNNSDKSTAKTSKLSSGGSITIESGGDTTLQGTKLDSKGDTNVAAGGNLNLTAKQESSSGMDLSLSLGGSASSKGESEHGESKDSSKKSANAGFDIGGNISAKETGGTISSGGKVNLSAGKNINTVGTQVDAKSEVNVSAGGTVNERAARSASIGGAIGAQGTVSSSKTTTTKDGSSSTKQTDKAGADVTDIGFSVGSSSQKTSLNSSGGKVSVKNGAKGPDVSNAGKPLPEDPEPKAEIAPSTSVKPSSAIPLNVAPSDGPGQAPKPVAKSIPAPTSVAINAAPSDGPGQAPKTIAKPVQTGGSIAINAAPSDGPGQVPKTVAAKPISAPTSIAIDAKPSDGPGQVPTTVAAPARPAPTSVAIDAKPSDGPGQVPTNVAAKPVGGSIAINAAPSDGPGQAPKTVAAPAKPKSISINAQPSDGPGQAPTPAPAAPTKP